MLLCFNRVILSAAVFKKYIILEGITHLSSLHILLEHTGHSQGWGLLLVAQCRVVSLKTIYKQAAKMYLAGYIYIYLCIHTHICMYINIINVYFLWSISLTHVNVLTPFMHCFTLPEHTWGGLHDCLPSTDVWSRAQAWNSGRGLLGHLFGYRGRLFLKCFCSVQILTSYQIIWSPWGNRGITGTN